MRQALSLLASLAVALALVGALELGLRTLGVGAADDHSQLKYQAVFTPVMSPDARSDGAPILRTTDPRLPYQQVPAAKAADTLRVYLLGGSAMAGLGFSPNVTVARHFERLLGECFPERRFEVVNLGIVALPLKKVKQLALDVLANGDPDLLVVYSGNNEFLELHARKYALVGAPLSKRLSSRIANTNLYRLIRPPTEVRPEDLVDLASNDARVSEERMVREVDVSPAEIRAVHDAYEADLEAVARAAREAGVPLALMTVAANWEWTGKAFPPEGWPEELAPGSTRPDGSTDWRAVVAALDAAPGIEGDHLLLNRRALAHRALGEHEAAARDFRASMHAAPHLRRASDALAERVRRVAERGGALLVDTIPHLVEASEHATIGFEFFYDYVHFTPRGAALTAGLLLRELGRAGLVPATCEAAISAAEVGHGAPEGPAPPDGLPDFAEVLRWRGVGLDPARITDRDLWKYEAALAELQAAAERGSDDWRVHAYLGNAAFFRHEGVTEAERHWRRALELGGPVEALNGNLARLDARVRAPAD